MIHEDCCLSSSRAGNKGYCSRGLADRHPESLAPARSTAPTPQTRPCQVSTIVECEERSRRRRRTRKKCLRGDAVGWKTGWPLTCSLGISDFAVPRYSTEG